MLAWSIPLLTGSLSSREPGQPITGSLPGASAQAHDPLAFFERRVQAHPKDVAARLDLAYRYLDVGQIPQAIDQYVAALRLDPENAEAHANLGLLLFPAGRPRVGLSQVDEALSVDPTYRRRCTSRA